MLAGLPLAAQARDLAVSIPAATLDVALTTLAREAGVEIVSTEPGLRAVRTRAIQGRMPVKAALDRLLDGTGYRATAIPGGGYRVVRAPIAAPAKAARPRPVPPPAPPAPSPPARPVADIVVTASKQRVPLSRYPGSLTVIDGDALNGAAGSDLSGVSSAIPILQSTQLGPGRNKIFIRGIADSSFNGATQSPTSIYLDDVQLNYSGPDPGLRLYDMQSVEVLEGPQGTLYGSGAIGGVIRLTSRAVDLTQTGGSVAAGTTATRGGAMGADAAAMVNVPLVADRIGLRAVGYAVRDGGYISDVGRGLSNVNRTDTVGGRVTLRVDPGDGWRVELGGAGQWIDMRDGQYAQAIAGPLARRTLMAQPFDNQLLFGRLVVTRDWDNGLRLFTATGIVAYRAYQLFDATPRPVPGFAPPPVIYTAFRDKQLLSHETRLSRSVPNGNSWVVGLSLISDQDILSRTTGSPGNDIEIIGVTNVTKSASLFGEGTIVLFRDLFATIGARVTTGRTDGNPSSAPRSNNFVKGRSTLRADPTLALTWRVAPSFSMFARFQTGYRTGGLAVASGVGRVADYRPDDITVGEFGVRKLRSGPTGISFSGSFSLARWDNIQADLITRRGQPYTTNFGNARIETLEGTIDWIPVAGLRAEASFLFTDNEVSGPIADSSQRNNRRLPETPPFAAHAGLSYQWKKGDVTFRSGVTTDYVGRSVLGTGDFLDVSQGKYQVVGLFAGVRRGRLDLDLRVDNLTGTKANRFAFGNPFELVWRDLSTPLRPLNARVGATWDW